jgi:hypothetical protein
MTETHTDETPNSTKATDITDVLHSQYPNREPVVRYGFPREEGGQTQELALRSIYESIPDEAITASAVYLITEDQRDRLEDLADNPYAIPGSDTNIVKEVQDECEGSGHVLYPVHAESDARDDGVTFATMTDWLRTFVRNVLDFDPEECTFYYSGSRSIHVHVPVFVTHQNLATLKDQAEQYCDEVGAELDTGVYKPKQQFRIPGAVHEKSGGAFQKVEIDTEWSHDKIIRAAGRGTEGPDTFADVLSAVFPAQEADEVPVLSSSTDDEPEKTIPTPLIEQKHYRRPGGKERWEAYNRKEFYPYPIGDGGSGRSVASLKVLGGAFQREEVGRGRTLVPAYFYGAHGCNGREFTKHQKYAPLQLSKADFEKWHYERGDILVIIGGASYQSRIIEVEQTTAKRVGGLLHPEEGRREDALNYLERKGYNTGSAGRSGTSRPNHRSREQGDYVEVLPVTSPTTEAAEFQQRVEQGGTPTEELDHGERRRVANRLLTIYGWNPTWQWFQKQYGDDFKPKRTWKGLRRVIKTHSEDLNHINVPPEP